ncbi:hypothetical protein D3C81_2156610 [compost metagenome]
MSEVVRLALAVFNAVGLWNIRIQCIIFLRADSHILELDTQIICGCLKSYSIVACVQMNHCQIILLEKFIPCTYAGE